MLKLGLIATALTMSMGGIVADDISSPEPTVVETGDVSSSVMPDGSGEEVFECTTSSKVYFINSDSELVEDTANRYGDVYVSASQGHVGDTVTAIVSGNPTMDVVSKVITLYKYAIAYVTVNGVKVEPSDSDKGEYTFQLVEGANDVIAYFQNKTQLSVMDLSTTDWKSLLTVDNLIRVIYLGLSLILSSGFFLTLIKSRKNTAKTSQEIEASATEVSSKIVQEQVNAFLTDTVKPLLEKQNEQTKDSNDTAKALMRVMMLAQEGTDESRLAILKELQNYKTSDAELAKQIQEIVDASIKSKEDAKQAQAEAIQAVKESIENIGTDTGKKDDYGTV